MPTKEEWLQRITYKRAALLASMDGIGQAGWAMHVSPGRTAQDVLAHIAAWETRVAAHLPALLANCGMSVVGVEADTFNAEQVALRQGNTPRELLDELAESCRRIQAALANASDDDLTRPRAVPWGQVTLEDWVLRELYEHDSAHAEELRAWRAAQPQAGRSLLDARIDDMAAQRAWLLNECLGLPADTLVAAPVMEHWTIKDLLTHVAAWDTIHTDRVALALAERETEIASVDPDERNAELYTQQRDWPLDEAVQAAINARQNYLGVLRRANDAQLVRPVRLPCLRPLTRHAAAGWRETSAWEFAYWRARHDETHAGHIQAWRKAAAPQFAPGPQCVLRAALEATRFDLTRQIDRLPPAGRETQPVAGEWTLKDLVGHIADWDRFVLQALRAMRKADQLPYVAEGEVDLVNARQAAARRGQNWEQAWADFQNTRTELVGALADWDDDQLAREIDYPLEWLRTAYSWAAMQIWHDSEHADTLRATNAL